jgi:mannose-6-phosphate isomerase-like protein (cupin superfamily)
MTTTFISTGECAKRKLAGTGEVAEVMNQKLCGAKNGLGMLRWLRAGERLEAGAEKNSHQLIYLMEGQGVITLNSKDYEVGKGAGIYLGPSEKASVRQSGGAPLKLFHLVVPKLAS